MAKIDKSLLTKQEYRALKAKQKLEKERQKLLQNSLDSIHDSRPTDPKTAFVLGNGTSRKSINPLDLRLHGKLYGCNALYRELAPDYLVAVDVKMIVEINQSGYQHKAPVWTNKNKAYKDFEGFNYFETSKGWSSGPTALWLASQHGYEKIYILGFDYQGLEEGKKFNNIYADTKNYKKSIEGATFYGNWLRQTEQVIKEHPHIRYYRVIAKDNFCPRQLNNFNNFTNVDIEDFKKIFNIS